MKKLKEQERKNEKCKMIASSTHSVNALGFKPASINVLDAYAHDLRDLAFCQTSRSGIVDETYAEDEVLALADVEVIIVDRPGCQ